MDECKYTDYNDIQISALHTHEYYITDINWSPPHTTTVTNHTNTHTMFTASSYTPKLQSIILFSMMLWALRCALNLSLLLNFLEQVGQTFKQSSLCWISSARMKNSMSHLIEQHSQVADILACYRDRVAIFYWDTHDFWNPYTHLCCRLSRSLSCWLTCHKTCGM